MLMPLYLRWKVLIWHRVSNDKKLVQCMKNMANCLIWWKQCDGHEILWPRQNILKRYWNEKSSLRMINWMVDFKCDTQKNKKIELRIKFRWQQKHLKNLTSLNFKLGKNPAVRNFPKIFQFWDVFCRKLGHVIYA